MSVDTRAAIVVGRHREDLFTAGVDLDDLDGDLDQICPYYDGGDDAIFGIKVARTGNHSAHELPEDLAQRIANAKSTFHASTGLDALVWLSPDVS